VLVGEPSRRGGWHGRLQRFSQKAWLAHAGFHEKLLLHVGISPRVQRDKKEGKPFQKLTRLCGKPLSLLKLTIPCCDGGKKSNSCIRRRSFRQGPIMKAEKQRTTTAAKDQGTRGTKADSSRNPTGFENTSVTYSAVRTAARFGRSQRLRRPGAAQIMLSIHGTRLRSKSPTRHPIARDSTGHRQERAKRKSVISF